MRYSLACFFARTLGRILLEDILKDGKFEVSVVVTHSLERDKKTERPEYKNYKAICECHNVPLLVTDNPKQEALEKLSFYKFDFLVANCYRYFIAEGIRSLASIESINMHRSLLPKYKGAKPLVRALAEGEKTVGTSVHILTDEVDSGEIIDRWPINVKADDTVQTLFNKLYPTQYPLFIRSTKILIEKKEKAKVK